MDGNTQVLAIDQDYNKLGMKLVTCTYWASWHDENVLVPQLVDVLVWNVDLHVLVTIGVVHAEVPFAEVPFGAVHDDYDQASLVVNEQAPMAGYNLVYH